MPDELEEIMKERGKKYGDYQVSMHAAGLMAQALLEMHYQIALPGPVPPHVIGHLNVCVKSSRACAPFDFEPDNYKDAHNYLEIAMKTDSRYTQLSLPGTGGDQS